TAASVWGISQLRRDTDWIIRATDETMALSSQEDFSFWPPLVAIFRRWADVERGDLSHPEKVKEAVDAFRGIGAGVLSTTGYSLALRGYLAAGRYEEGLTCAEEARSYVERSQEHHFESEVDRLEGELMGALARQRGSDEELGAARARVERAASFASARRARSLELRAAMSLVNLAQDKTRPDAVAGLREIYDWFSEGFDTPDLVDARKLLETP